MQPAKYCVNSNQCITCSQINQYCNRHIDGNNYQCLTCTLTNHIIKADHVSAINTCICIKCCSLVDPIDGFTARGGAIICNHCTNQINCDNCHKQFTDSKGCIAVKGKIYCSACVHHSNRSDAPMLRCDQCRNRFSSKCLVSVQSGHIACPKCTSTFFTLDQVVFQQYIKKMLGPLGSGESHCKDFQYCPPTQLTDQNNTECVHNVDTAPSSDSDSPIQVQLAKIGSASKCCCQSSDCPFETKNFYNCDCSSIHCKYHVSNTIIDQSFGFTPLQKLQHPPSHFTIIKPFNHLSISQILQKSQIPNPFGPKFILPSPFNLPLWHFFLQHYWDVQLLSFLACGFPLDITSKPQASKDFVNHSSAVKYDPHVQHYLDTELKHSAILGPFLKSPLKSLHLSPMMTRPKQGSNNHRVIIDLSWPKGQSINDNIHPSTYMGTPFLLKFPTIDDITGRIKALKSNCLIYKVDLQRAFRQLRLDPGDIVYTGLSFDNKTYVDTAIPFGYRHGSMACQRFTDAIRFVMHQHGYFLANYIDDLIGCDPPKIAYAGYQFLLTLLKSLGVPISQDKLCSPSTQVICLGIDLNVTTGTITIPSPKLHDIHSECLLWLDRDFATKRQIQALLGVLLYIHKCVVPARVFVNRILFTLRMAPDAGRIRLNHAFKRDIRWFTTFLHHFNGRVFYDKTHKQTPLFLYLDACLDGLGAFVNNQVYHLHLQDKVFLPPDHSIVHLEMINILVALRAWAHIFSGRQVVSYCDNAAVVSICQSGRSKDPCLAAIARNIWWLTAACDIDLQLVHISGHHNTIADALSRWHKTTTNKNTLFNFMANPNWCDISVHQCLIDFSI